METITEATGTQAILDRWSAICADLEELPYKFELRRNGEIVMTVPPGTDHSEYQTEITKLLFRHAKGGRVYTVLSVVVDGGVKTLDNAWAANRLPRGVPASPVMPDVCIEVTSPSNRKGEYLKKRRAYFAGGAKEFWTVSKTGEVTFWIDAETTAKRSKLIPNFPTQVEL